MKTRFHQLQSHCLCLSKVLPFQGVPPRLPGDDISQDVDFPPSLLTFLPSFFCFLPLPDTSSQVVYGTSLDGVQGFSTSAPLTFGAPSFFVVGTAPYIVGCLATSLVSIYQMPVAPPPASCDNQKCLQTLSNIPWGKITPS